MASGYFSGFKIFSFNNIFVGFQKTECFGGMKILCFVECFWGHHKIGIYLEVILGSYLKVRVRNGGCFWGC